MLTRSLPASSLQCVTVPKPLCCTSTLQSSSLYRKFFQQPCRPKESSRRKHVVTHMGLRALENFDGTFEISEDCRTALTALLNSDAFCNQVAKESNLQEGKRLKFAGILFQPVPWSVNTKKGMPAEYEQYLDDPNYVVINVPPNYMFKAKVFKPSRLCAIFQAI